jgi:hypothetical protein
MTKFIDQYKYEPTSVRTVRWCRMLEDLGLGAGTVTLFGIVCLGTLLPNMPFNSAPMLVLGILATVELSVGIIGLLGLWVWRRSVQRLVEQKK